MKQRVGSQPEQVRRSKRSEMQTSAHPSPSSQTVEQVQTNAEGIKPAEVLHLQQTVGNQAVGRLIRRATTAQTQTQTSNSSQGSEEFDYMITHPHCELHDVFEKYCKREWSVENLMAWDDIQFYQQFPSRRQAVQIWNNYFDPSAVYEINVDRKQLQSVAQVIEEYEKAPTKSAWGSFTKGLTTALGLAKHSADAHLFDGTLPTIKGNMLDTWARFILTPDYRNYKEDN